MLLVRRQRLATKGYEGLSGRLIGRTENGDDRGGSSSSGAAGGAAAAYSLTQMHVATDGFSDSRRIDEGAYGAVFHGVLPSGVSVAVKVLTAKEDAGAAPSDYSGAKSFAIEAEVLGQYRHANIVALLGHCLGAQQPQQYLVYEFMPGGSLYKRLSLRGGPALTALTVPERFDVASDIARGLQYLHFANPPIIHQDIKSDNILLGEHEGRFVAKIADFGAARITPSLLVNTHYSAREVVGTRPYQAPEYAIQGHVSEKTDAFAFGVVLLELLTSKPPSTGERTQCLYSELAPVLSDAEAQLPPLLDRRAGPWSLPSALALAHIAQRCLAMHAHARVAVSDVLVELDVLAGRQAIRRAGRGQHFDPYTGKLVNSDASARETAQPSGHERTSEPVTMPQKQQQQQQQQQQQAQGKKKSFSFFARGNAEQKRANADKKKKEKADKKKEKKARKQNTDEPEGDILQMGHVQQHPAASRSSGALVPDLDRHGRDLLRSE